MAEDKGLGSLVDRNSEGSDSETCMLTNLEAVAATMEKQIRLTHSVRELQAEQGRQIEQLIWNFNNRLDEIGTRLNLAERSLDSGLASVREEMRGNYERTQFGSIPLAFEMRISDLEARLQALENSVQKASMTEERMASVHAKLLASVHTELKEELSKEIRNELDEHISEIKVEILERNINCDNESSPRKEGISTWYGHQSMSGSSNVNKDGGRAQQSRPVPKPRSRSFIDGGIESTPVEPYLSLNKRPVQKPMPYGGTTTWDAYFAQFQIIAQVNNWNDREKAAFLATSLKGQALTVLGSLRQDDRYNFEMLVNALSNRFGNAHQTELARVRFKNRLKQRDESLPELSQEIERLARLSYPDAPSTVQDVLARDQFIDALVDDEVRLRIKHERPKTLQEALSLALEFESFQLASRQHRSKYARVATATYRGYGEGKDQQFIGEGDEVLTKKPSPPTEGIRHGNEQLMEIATRLEKAMQECLRGIQMAVEKQKKPRRGCWNCEAKDHIRRNCPLLEENKPDGRPPASPPHGNQGNER